MLFCALALGVVQLLIAVLASVATRGMSWAAGPRDAPGAPLGKIAGRLDRAYWNFLETFLFFAAAVLLIHALDKSTATSVLGLVLAATIAPLMSALERRGWNHGRAAIGATLGATFGVILIVVLTLVSLAGPVSDLVSQATAGAGAADDSLAGNAGPLVTLVQTFGIGVVATITSLVSNTASLGVVLLLAVLLMYYFIRDGASFWRTFLDRVEPGRRSYVEAAGGRAFNVLGGYMLGTGAISIFGAATQFLIMTILGIPLALPLAVLAVFGGFIPYIGSLITTGLAFLVTVATGTPQDIAIMAIFTIVFNIVQGNFVAPIVYSRVVSLHPAVVLAAIPAGNQIAGIVGMFLVVPFLGVVAAVWRTVLRVLDTEPVEPLPAPDPEVEAPDPALSTAPSA
jgi:predicted PurR-regulated permease PerM